MVCWYILYRDATFTFFIFIYTDRYSRKILNLFSTWTASIFKIHTKTFDQNCCSLRPATRPRLPSLFPQALPLLQIEHYKTVRSAALFCYVLFCAVLFDECLCVCVCVLKATLIDRDRCRDTHTLPFNWI